MAEAERNDEAEEVDESAGPGTPVPETAVDPRIAAAVAGDRRAAELLLRGLLPRIRNLVRYLLRGDSMVDDVAQNVMIEVMKSLPRFRGEGSLEAWTDRICVRVTLAQARRGRTERHRRAASAPELEVVTTRGSVAPPPDALIARREAVALLDEIPADQRAALVLHHVAGMSVPEIAERLGVPFDTAKSRLRLGIKKLRAAHRRGDRIGEGLEPLPD